MSVSKYFLLRVIYDLIAIIPIVVLAAVLMNVSPFQRGYFKDDQSLKLPFRTSTVSAIYLFTVAPILSITIIVITELLRAYKYGIATKYKGVYLVGFCAYKYIYLMLFGYVTIVCIIQVGKIIIGELRPNFFDVCQPTGGEVSPYGYVTNFNCSGSNQHGIDEVRLSFPSAHSACSMYPAMFIAIYLNYRMPDIFMGSKLQAFIQVGGITAAFFVGLTRISDNKHHPHDVLVGFIIGAVAAVFTARYAKDVHEFDEVEGVYVERV